MYRAARSALYLRRGKANRPLGKQQNRNLEDVPSDRGVHRLRGYMGQDRGGSKANRPARWSAHATAWTAIRPVTAALEMRSPGLKLRVETGPNRPGPRGARPRPPRTATSPARYATAG